MIVYKESVGEKEVEHFWWGALKKLFPKNSIEARGVGHNTDGVLIDNENDIRTLIEVKCGLDLRKPSDQAKVLIQSIFYIKQFESKSNKRPKSVFIGDKKEAFVIHTNLLIKYLDYDIDWSTAPSQAYKIHIDMLMDIINDDKINPFVFDISVPGFNFNEIKDKLIDLNQNIKRLIKITEKNIQRAFEGFNKNVLETKTLSINEEVNLFIDLLINPSDNYLHPVITNTLVTKSYGNIKVKQNRFESFFNHMDGKQYSVLQKEKLVSIIDRLIEDESRKRNGEFFTPSIWVDEAHDMISAEFGADWKEKYIVWDCAWGTGNLTRDYKFNNLYCSSLHQSDIDTANQMQINMDATKFQFDFLNDDLNDLKTKAPKLLEAINSGKEIIFLINPPYGKATGLTGKVKSTKGGLSDTKTSILMKDSGWGASSAQLYAQFMFNINNINNINKNVKLAIFSTSIYKTSVTFKKFREKFYNNFNYLNGMLFNASHFSDTANTWGIDFSIWNNEKGNNEIQEIILKDIVDMDITVKGIKKIYNLDNKDRLSNWLTLENKKLKPVPCPNLSSAIKVKETKKMLPENHLGTFNNHGNSVYKNATDVYFLSSASTSSNLPIMHNNFRKCIVGFTVRKTIKSNWINCKDEYIAPTEAIQDTLQYKQFVNDSIIYSLFNTGSNQSALRLVNYNGKRWNIKNEFFFFPTTEMMHLADSHYFDDVYQGARSNDDRFVYKLLNGKLTDEEFEEVGITYVDENRKPILSPDAQELYNLAKEFLVNSFLKRQIIHDESPEFYLNTFDAGWYQLKKVLQKFYKKDYEDFNNKYKAFGDRLRPQVYELGFLLK